MRPSDAHAAATSHPAPITDARVGHLPQRLVECRAVSVLEDALEAYERVRVLRANAVAAASAARAAAVHTGRPDTFNRSVGEDSVARREQLFGYDATTVELAPR